jgi:hypothetical protein
MKLRSVRPLGPTDLQALTTERLLAYRSRLLELNDSAATSGLDESERAALDPTLLHFKNEANWIEAYATVKSILSTRRHVD